MTYVSDFHSDFRPDLVGQLLLGLPERGKRVFTWKYQRLGDETVEVEVHLLPQRGENYQRPIFSTSCTACPQAFLRHTDLDVLAKQVEEKLNFHLGATSAITWEDWLEIQVEGSASDFASSVHAGAGSNLKINVCPLKKGKHPKTGQMVTVNFNRCLTLFPEPRQETEHGRTVNVSYIPDTPENRTALEVILQKMRDLRGSLSDLLSQDNAVKSLQRIDAQYRLQ